MHGKYKFDFGDTSYGPLGFCAEVHAQDPKEAVQKLIDALPGDFEIMKDGDGNLNPPIGYITVYFNQHHVSEADIIDSESCEEEDRCPLNELPEGEFVPHDPKAVRPVAAGVEYRSDKNNAIRIALARLTILHHTQKLGMKDPEMELASDPNRCLTDILSDLLHFSYGNKLDFETALHLARSHVDSEADGG